MQLEITNSVVFQQLLALARGVRDGNQEAGRSLARRISHFKNPERIIAFLGQYLRKEQVQRKKTAEQRRHSREKLQRPEFPKTHPAFRKKRKGKARKCTDAMNRAILCGGFETNRSRH